MSLGLALAAGGAILGGIGGAFAKKPGRISLEKAKQRNNFTSGLGTATANGFSYNQGAVPGQQQAMQTSGQQLNSLLSGGLAIDPNRQARYQQAFYDSRAPDMLRQQQQQTNALGNARASSGQAGSMSALLGSSLLQDNQQRQLAQLQSQSVLGGEALANTALNQDIARSNAYNSQLQQGFSNQLNAQTATQNVFNAQAGLDINFANQRNAASMGQFRANEANRNFSRFGSIASGAIGGGLAGANMSSSLNLGGGSSGGIGASASSAFDQAMQAGSSPAEAYAIANGQRKANAIGSGSNTGGFGSFFRSF